MQSPFNEAYNQQIINESLKNIFASPKVLLATAAMLGIIDFGYVIPKLSEIQNKVEQHLQQKTPEQVQQIETRAVQHQNAPKILQIYNKIKNYKPKPPTPHELNHFNDEQPANNAQISLDFYNKARNMIKNDEGREPQLYKDTKNKWTIGYGHLIKNQDELKKYQNKTLDDKELDALLDSDIKAKIKIALNLFPKFNQYNDNFKLVLLNGIFRGDISGSPNTINLINRGKYKQAAKEYLDHEDYKAASKPGAKDRGVAIRMLRNAKIIAKQSNK